MNKEQNRWLQWVSTFSDSLFGTLRVIVETASEDSAEIAIRALPLVSPLPNAIGLFFVAQSSLGFGVWQAATFALSSELALFGLVDVLLRVFDGYLVNRKRYLVPLWAAGVCAITMLLIIVGVVYKLEVAHAGGNAVLAVLPFISGVGAIALAVRRWDKNQVDQTIVELKAKLCSAEGSVTELTNQVSELQAERQNQNVIITELHQSAADMRSQIISLAERVDYWKAQAESRPAGVLEPEKQPTKQSSTTDRRMAVLKAIAQTAKRSDVNFTELGSQHGVSDTAIKKDIKWLVSSGHWVNGDTWKPTPQGLVWAGLEVNAN